MVSKKASYLSTIMVLEELMQYHCLIISFITRIIFVQRGDDCLTTCDPESIVKGTEQTAATQSSTVLALSTD